MTVSFSLGDGLFSGDFVAAGIVCVGEIRNMTVGYISRHRSGVGSNDYGDGCDTGEATHNGGLCKYCSWLSGGELSSRGCVKG